MNGLRFFQRRRYSVSFAGKDDTGLCFHHLADDLGGIMCRNSSLAILAFVSAASLLAQFAAAADIAWLLDGVTFTDGGTASGYFVYNADTGGFGDFSLSTSGGNTTDFPPFVYDETDAFGSTHQFDAGLQPSLLFTQDGSGSQLRQFRVTPTDALTDAGGTTVIVLDYTGSNECFNCNPFRHIASGNLIADTIFIDGFE
jgi:hypothetical protein